MTRNQEQAPISWIDETIPCSSRFDDTYYAKSNGQLETQHVYLSGNNLPARWRQQEVFRIGELGFGTGLNFLETLRIWKNDLLPNAQLHFISFEQYPLDRQQMEKALSRWENLDDLAARLCTSWQTNNTILELDFTPQVKLTVHLGDANHTITALNQPVDAWYLDGFSPAKNPQLWNLDLMQRVYDHTGPQGTFATYTVAGYVRRNLHQAGFELERKKGFGSKREMLVGRKT